MDIEVFKELLADKKYDLIKKTLVDMNEFDIASLISELPDDMIIQAFRLLPKNIATDVFVNMDDEVQRNLIANLTKAEQCEFNVSYLSNSSGVIFSKFGLNCLIKWKDISLTSEGPPNTNIFSNSNLFSATLL